MFWKMKAFSRQYGSWDFNIFLTFQGGQVYPQHVHMCWRHRFLLHENWMWTSKSWWCLRLRALHSLSSKKKNETTEYKKFFFCEHRELPFVNVLKEYSPPHFPQNRNFKFVLFTVSNMLFTFLRLVYRFHSRHDIYTFCPLVSHPMTTHSCVTSN